MSNAVVIYDNFADDAVLSGGSYLASLPLSNLQNEDIQLVARSTDALNASTKFSVDFGSVRPIGGIVLGPTNLSPGATWRVRSFAEAAHSTVMYDSGVQTVSGSTIDWSDTNDWLEWEDPGFWYGIPDSFSLNDLPSYIAEIVDSADAADALAQYWLVETFDAGNADGHVDFGRLLFGRVFRPTFNYGTDNSFNVSPLNTTPIESLGGRRFFWDRGQRRVLHLSFPMLSNDELFDDVFRIQNVVSNNQQVFISPDPADTTNFDKRSFLATLSNPPPIVQALADVGSTVIEAEEVL